MKHLAIVLALGVLVCLAPVAMANTTYTFQTIIDPGDTAFTQTLGINNAGTIAGYFGDGVVVPNNGFTVTPPYGSPSFTPENFPGALQTQVIGINNSGETVGFWIDAGGTTHGFADVSGTFTSVDDPSTTTLTQLLGVNDSGTAAGYYINSKGNAQPFTYASGTFTGISFSGEVSAQATDVNNSGWITGFNQATSTTSEGFLDVGGTFTFLNFPGSTFTEALGLNNEGEVVGSYVDASGNTHGFLYNIAAETYQEIDDPSAVGPGGTTINGTNDSGQIVGFFTNADGNTDGFVGTPAPTPESPSLILMATGLFGLCVYARKRLASPAS
jgi:hypothetical protein